MTIMLQLKTLTPLGRTVCLYWNHEDATTCNHAPYHTASPEIAL